MGKRSRPRPVHLAEKLLRIRLALGLSQPEMHKRLGLEDDVEYTTISKYERDKNEPPLHILLRYARLARVLMEDIVDDELDLPDKIPGNARHQGVKRKSASGKSKR